MSLALKQILCALGAACVLLYQVPGDWVSQWGAQWTILHFALTAFVCLGLAKNTHWSVGLFALVLLASGIHAGEWQMVATSVNASMLGLALVMLFFSILGDRSIIFELGFVVCMMSSVYTLYWQNKLGFVANESMNGCLIALTWPLALARNSVYLAGKKELPLVITLVSLHAWAAVFYSGEATPIMMLTAMVFAEFYAKKKYSWMAVALVPLGIGYLMQGDQLTAPRGRIDYWRNILGWWVDSGKILFGNGSGTGQIIFPTQGIIEHKPKWVFWAHSDYVQLLFENGVIGLAAFGVLLYFLLKRSLSRPLLFSAVVGYAVCMIFNSPSHHALHAFFGASLVWLVYQREGA